jgi:hypothetical protein
VTKIAKNSKASDLGVKMTGTPKTGQTVTLGQETALQTLFGTKIPEMAEALLGHCLKVLASNEASDDHPGSDERIFMLAAVEEIKPRDAVERMLAVQMAATHVAVIRQGGRMAHAEGLPQFEAHERAFNKLARTFTAQVEALRKHRTGGKQTVTVQHVNVSEGGQAIVGNVQAGGRGNDGK